MIKRCKLRNAINREAKAKGMNLEEYCSEVLCLSYSYVKLLINGKHNHPGRDVIQSICDHTGLTPEEVVSTEQVPLDPARHGVDARRCDGLYRVVKGLAKAEHKTMDEVLNERGLSYDTVHKIWSGGCGMSTDMRDRICRALGKSREELFDGTEV